jgi:hypothetical protein
MRLAISFPPPFTGEAIRRTGGGILAALLLLTPASAGWREDASASDVQRIGQLAESRAKGMMEAANAGASDFAAVSSIVEAGVLSAAPSRLVGTWRCRTMKLGGLTPAIVYSWFACRISQQGGRLVFEKIGGSQRTVGTLYPDGGGYVYLGASYVHYNGVVEKPPRYSGKGSSLGAGQTPDDQIGLLSFTRDGRARLEFPYPVQESVYDVIELKR